MIFDKDTITGQFNHRPHYCLKYNCTEYRKHRKCPPKSTGAGKSHESLVLDDKTQQLVIPEWSCGMPECWNSLSVEYILLARIHQLQTYDYIITVTSFEGKFILCLEDGIYIDRENNKYIEKVIYNILAKRTAIIIELKCYCAMSGYYSYQNYFVITVTRNYLKPCMVSIKYFDYHMNGFYPSDGITPNGLGMESIRNLVKNIKSKWKQTWLEILFCVREIVRLYLLPELRYHFYAGVIEYNQIK